MSLSLYPFGSSAGDTTTEKTDDGGSGPIKLNRNFTFYGKNYAKLYLACILNMVPSWKAHTALRVFLPVSAADAGATARKQQKLELFLRQLRILARIQPVDWDPQIGHTPTAADGVASKGVEDSAPTSSADDGSEGDVSKMQEYQEVPENYLTAVNELIISNSVGTAVTFLYLPTPPQEEAAYAKYLSQLDGLTQNLRPTVLVHGLHPVTSTTL